VGGSLIGGIKETQEMLGACALLASGRWGGGMLGLASWCGVHAWQCQRSGAACLPVSLPVQRAPAAACQPSSSTPARPPSVSAPHPFADFAAEKGVVCDIERIKIDEANTAMVGGWVA